MVSLVLVSHSLTLAESLVTLIEQMVQDLVKIAVAAGVDDPDHPWGTDVINIQQAIESVYSDDGVLVLMDLGSAVLSAEMAVEFLNPEQQTKVKLSAAPLVEGAIAAAIMASTGASLEVVTTEAQQALNPKLSQLETSQPTPSLEPSKPLSENSLARVIKVNTKDGLHIRPAAKFVKKANEFATEIKVRKRNKSSEFIDGKSLNQLMLLGVKQGEEIEIEAVGENASIALTSLQDVIEQSSLETDGLSTPLTLTLKPQKLPLTRDELRGIPASPGTAIAPGQFYQPTLPEVTEKISQNPETQWQKFQQAIHNAKEQIESLITTNTTNNAIFQAHLIYLDDPDLHKQTKQLIFEQQYTAAFAWKTIIDQTITEYKTLETDYLQARAIDLLDLGQRVLKILLEVEIPPFILDVPSIIIASQLAPSQVTQFNPEQVLGIATAFGSATDHSAIIASLLGIPMVVGVGEDLLKLTPNTPLKIDGTTGVIQLNPSPETAQIEPSYPSISPQPGITRDGHHITLVANIIGVRDAQLAMSHGSQGVGLLRTEFLYLDRRSPPSEAEQVEFYQAIAQIIDPYPLTIRTADLGGDKSVPYLNFEQEANPFLGQRGIRQSLANPDFFKLQLRAILRVSAEFNLRVMLPMISCLEEIKLTKQLIKEVQQELQQEKIPFNETLPLGIMLEVPAAVIIADQLASEVDFFSLGTNDLTQYLMAADRTNPQVINLTTGLPPALLRCIEQSVRIAQEKGIKVSVCGQLASSPDAIPILLGLGVNELSINPPMISQIRDTIAQLSLE